MSERRDNSPSPRFELGAEQLVRLRKDIDLVLLGRLLAKLTDTDRARVLKVLEAEVFSPESSANGFLTLEVPLLPSEELRRELAAVLAPARARLEDAGTVLEGAIARLLALRTAEDSPPQTTRIDVDASARDAVLPAEVKRALAICLQGAREGRVESVPEIGAARTVEVWLPGSRR